LWKITNDKEFYKMFWVRFSELCSTNHVSANAVCAKLGLSTATATHWKNGTMPKGDVLLKLADYFDTSVDYLLGRAVPTKAMNSHNTISGNNNIIGNGNTAIGTLSDQEQELLHIFSDLGVLEQAKLLVFAADLKKTV
jgi:transcriptional regulator with XRE-family HTH domain